VVAISRLRGTHIQASIPIRQHVFDELLASRTNIAAVAFHDADVLIATVFGISLKARILRVGPMLEVVLGVSYLVRLALWPVKSRLPFVTTSGNEVIVDLAHAVAMYAPEYTPVVQHARMLELRSSRGLLAATIEFKVE